MIGCGKLNETIGINMSSGSGFKMGEGHSSGGGRCGRGGIVARSTTKERAGRSIGNDDRGLASCVVFPTNTPAAAITSARV